MALNWSISATYSESIPGFRCVLMSCAHIRSPSRKSLRSAESNTAAETCQQHKGLWHVAEGRVTLLDVGHHGLDLVGRADQRNLLARLLDEDLADGRIGLRE